MARKISRVVRGWRFVWELKPRGGGVARLMWLPVARAKALVVSRPRSAGYPARITDQMTEARDLFMRMYGRTPAELGGEAEFGPPELQA